MGKFANQCKNVYMSQAEMMYLSERLENEEKRAKAREVQRQREKKMTMLA